MEMYIQRGLSCEQIAKETGKHKQQVKSWLKRYGIPRRSAIETRFPHRPKPPDRETLYALYWIRWLSYDEIAELYQVDKTTIPYWLDKFSIPHRTISETRGNGRKEPTKQELEELYTLQGFSIRDIAALLGTSDRIIASRMKKFDIAIRLPGYSQERFQCTDGHTVISNLERRVDEWLNSHNLSHAYEPPLPFGGKSDFLVGNIYIEIWGMEHSQRYHARSTIKKRLYKKFGLHLISLTPKDVFRNLDSKLSILLAD